MDSGVRFAQQEQLAKRRSQMVGGEGTEEKPTHTPMLLYYSKNKNIT